MGKRQPPPEPILDFLDLVDFTTCPLCKSDDLSIEQCLFDGSRRFEATAGFPEGHTHYRCMKCKFPFTKYCEAR